MRELTLTGPGALEWRDASEPGLSSPRAALVRPVAVSTCDFDHLLVAGRTPLPLPLAIGHESVAVVEAVGDEVRSVAPGDTVVVPFQVSCGECAACLRGRTSSCERVPWLSCYGLGEASGGFGGVVADLVAVPYADSMLVQLPEGVDPAHAAAASCNVPDAYRCVVPQLQSEAGAPVLVAGGAFGNIALLAVELALAAGAGRVDYVDRDPERARQAVALGAQVIESFDDVEPGAYPITVDASQDTDLLAAVLRATAPDGTSTVSTMYPGAATPVPLFEMFARGVTLTTGQPHVRSLLEPSLEMMASGAIDTGAIVDRVLGWDEAPEAWRAGSGKVVCVRD